MMMGPVKKKNNELEKELSRICWAYDDYSMELVIILREEGLLTEKLFKELLAKYKKLLRDVDEHKALIRLMMSN